MDNAWNTLKKIIVFLFCIYIASFLIYTDFLLDIFEYFPKFDTSRYFYKILNLE